jgi:hypothetical protein
VSGPNAAWALWPLAPFPWAHKHLFSKQRPPRRWKPMEQFTQKLPGHLWLWLLGNWWMACWVKWSETTLRQCMAVPSFRLDEKCHFSYHFSYHSDQANSTAAHSPKILPRHFQSQDNGTLCRQCRCHRSKSFPRTCRWSGDDLQNLRKPGSIQGNLGFAVPPAKSSRKKND